MTCPVCGCQEDDLEGLNVVELTTSDDALERVRRLALRCQQCGYATSFLYYEQELKSE